MLKLLMQKPWCRIAGALLPGLADTLRLVSFLFVHLFIKCHLQDAVELEVTLVITGILYSMSTCHTIVISFAQSEAFQ